MYIYVYFVIASIINIYVLYKYKKSKNKKSKLIYFLYLPTILYMFYYIFNENVVIPPNSEFEFPSNVSSITFD